MKIKITASDEKGGHLNYNFDSSSSLTGIEEVYIGRAKDCQIQLDDFQISRHHSVLKIEENRASIEKISHLSSLIINGNKIEKRADLKTSDMISIGTFTLLVEIQNEIQNEIEEQVQEKNKEEKQGPIEEKTMLAPLEVSPDESVLTSEKDESNDEFSFEKSQEDDPEVNNSMNSEEESNDPFASGDNNFLDASSDEGATDSSDPMAMGADLAPTGDEMNSLDEGGEGEKTEVLGDFAQFILSISGEHAPFDEYFLKEDEIKIGRDKEKCQLVVNDTEISLEHALLKKRGPIYLLIDLESENGTILNGKRINEVALKEGDEFILGNTSFDVRVESKSIQREKEILMPVQNVQEIEVQKVVEEEVSFDDEIKVPGEEKKSSSLFSKESLSDPEKRKKILMIAIVILGGFLLLDEEEVEVKKGDAQEQSKGANKQRGEGENKSNSNKKEKKKKIFTPEEIEYLEAAYNLTKELFNKGMYKEAEFEINKIFALAPDGYKESNQLKKLIQDSYKQLALLEQKEQREKEEQVRRKKVEELVVKAKEAVKERNVTLAESLFSKIFELDPEQPEVGLLKLELDSWKKEKERKEIEEAQKKAERKRQENAFRPGKGHYEKKEWYQAIVRLDEFLQDKNLDDDLMKEASEMYKESKDQLDETLRPLLEKAQSLRDGQDLKGAYESYLEVLKNDPNHVEALNEINSIRESLDGRARKIYREGIISESLSLFDNAKEKFEQVQQISPLDSYYYKMATEKLKKYFD